MDNQQDYLKESLTRGSLFEVMMNQDGWKLVQDYYLNRMAELTNRMFASDGDIVQFQHEVDEIRGLRKLFESIKYDVDVLNEQRTGTNQPIGNTDQSTIATITE